MATSANVSIFTDGACRGNPGPGGYGAILACGAHRRELSGGCRLTTNNRMELLAVIVALRALKTRCKVTLYSDSKYVVETLTFGWARRWRANGWMKTRTEPARNPDLWETLLTLCAEHEVSLRWVKGHAGHPENERCDQLSQAAARLPDLPADDGFEDRGKVAAGRELF